MKIWEYKTVQADFLDKLETKLNELGKEGWELVGIIRPYYAPFTAFLKREKSM